MTPRDHVVLPPRITSQIMANMSQSGVGLCNRHHSVTTETQNKVRQEHSIRSVQSLLASKPGREAGALSGLTRQYYSLTEQHIAHTSQTTVMDNAQLSVVNL